jgi:flagellar biosynthesis chaperone FliJ
MEKDFKLAVVSEVDEVEWKVFLENPFQESEVPICPLHLLQTYQEVESYSTLSEKETNLILNYKKKAQAKQVSFIAPEAF